jgi:hypothetical protein
VLPARSSSWVGREETVEEGAVPGEGHAEVFGGHVVTAVPLCFEPFTLLGKAGCEALHQVGDQGVRFRDCVAGLVDEAGLDFLPAAGEALALVAGKERLVIGAGAGGLLRSGLTRN